MFYATNVNTPVSASVDCVECLRHVNAIAGRVVTHSTPMCQHFNNGWYPLLGELPNCQACLLAMTDTFDAPAATFSALGATSGRLAVGDTSGSPGVRVNDGTDGQQWVDSAANTTDVSKLEKRIAELEGNVIALTALCIKAGLLEDMKSGELMKTLNSGKQVPLDLHEGHVYVSSIQGTEPPTCWDQLDD